MTKKFVHGMSCSMVLSGAVFENRLRMVRDVDYSNLKLGRNVPFGCEGTEDLSCTNVCAWQRCPRALNCAHVWQVCILEVHKDTTGRRAAGL